MRHVKESFQKKFTTFRARKGSYEIMSGFTIFMQYNRSSRGKRQECDN